MGMYKYKRNGIEYMPYKTMQEVVQWIIFNKSFIDNHEILLYAGDIFSYTYLRSKGFENIMLCDNAPKVVIENSAHYMKFWFIYKALQKYDEIIWLDWDTYIIRHPDLKFFEWERSGDKPKFVYIRGYKPVVNTSVLYVNQKNRKLLEKAVKLMEITWPPNDELLWKKILPKNITSMKDYWWFDLVLNIWEMSDLEKITRNTYILHIRSYDLLRRIL